MEIFLFKPKERVKTAVQMWILTGVIYFTQKNHSVWGCRSLLAPGASLRVVSSLLVAREWSHSKWEHLVLVTPTGVPARHQLLQLIQLEQGVGWDGLQRSLPTTAALWLCAKHRLRTVPEVPVGYKKALPEFWGSSCEDMGSHCSVVGDKGSVGRRQLGAELTCMSSSLT